MIAKRGFLSEKYQQRGPYYHLTLYKENATGTLNKSVFILYETAFPANQSVCLDLTLGC